MPSSDAPLASIVVVTFQSASTIADCLDAVRSCTPEPHELVVVDNASSDATREIVRAHGAVMIENPTNRGFSAACNQGIAATGARRVVLLNPDTRVTPGWLGRLLAPLEGDVGAVGPLSNYVAADQRADRHVARIGGPAPASATALADALARANAGETLETKLLIGFCLALRRDLIEKLGGLDEDLFLGNDDLELSHRLRRAGYRLLVATDAFVYHAGQRSFRALAKGEADRLVQESTDALQRKLEREYGVGRVPPPAELWGIDWFRPAARVSIVIPAWNNVAYTRTCLRSLAQYTPEPHEVIVVDNGSTDETPSFLASRPEVRTIRNAENRGFAAACNQGIEAATGEHVCLLNNDVVVTPGWLDGMLGHLRRDPKLGVVGPRTNYASGPQLVRDVGYRSLDGLEGFAREFTAAHRGERIDFPRVTGLCMLLSGACRRAVGLLDERFGIGNYEDDDYCVRARRAGFSVAIAGDVFVHHFGSRTFRAMGVNYGALLQENRAKFLAKWSDGPTPVSNR